METPLRPALFLDRDGVINEEIGYLNRVEDLRLFTGAAELIRTANELGLPVIVVTNQGGIGRGLYSDAQFHTLMHAMRAELAGHNATLDAVYYSPFNAEHGLGDYKRDSECRKPRPGMLLRAAAEHHLDLHRSTIVGDRCSDMQAGEAAGVPHRFLLAGTEKGPCACAGHRPVQRLEEVTAWLQQHYQAHAERADAVPA